MTSTKQKKLKGIGFSLKKVPYTGTRSSRSVSNRAHIVFSAIFALALVLPYFSGIRANATVFVNTSASDISVTKSVDNVAPAVGDTVTFTVTASNNGPADATNVSVADALPAGLTVAGAIPSQGNYTASIWTVGSLSNGSSANLVIYAKVGSGTDCSVLTNTAVASADQSDSNSGNNTASASVTVKGTECGGGSSNADLSVTKTVDNPVPGENDTVEFTVTVKNNGPVGATNVSVADALPAGLTIAGVTPGQGSYSGTTHIWSVGSLANGATASLHIYAKVGAGTACSSIVNTAVVSADQSDPNTFNNSASASVSVQGTGCQSDTPATNYGLTVLKLGDGSGAVTSNPAGVSCGSVCSYDFASGTKVTLTAAPDATSTFSGWSGACGGTALTCDVTLTGSASVRATFASLPGSGNPDLQITKTVDNSKPAVGDMVLFTITAKNNDESNIATNVMVNDVMPAGLQIVSAIPSRGTYCNDSSCGTVGLWTVGNIAPQASVTLNIYAKVLTAAMCSSVVNTATVSSDQTDLNTGNNSASAALSVSGTDCGGNNNGCGSDCNDGSDTGALKITKIVVGGTATSSDFTIHVNNVDDDELFDATTSQPGSSTGAFYNGLYPRSYVLSEDGPDGYIASYSNSCAEGNVTVVAGQEVDCTITNTWELELSDEQAPTVTDTSITIAWHTNHPATSRVVYDTASHSDSAALAAGPDNYGYTSSTVEADGSPKVTSHSVTITGLTPGTAYYFRPVSHGSPQVVGSEIVVSTSDSNGGGGCVSGCGGGSISVGGGSSYVGSPVSSPKFSFIGLPYPQGEVAGAFTDIPSGQVLGATKTLPKTGVPPVGLLLLILTAVGAGFAGQRLSLKK